MELNSSELAAVKDCLKRYIEFNNNGVMSTYKVRQSNLLLLDEKEIDIDYKKGLNSWIETYNNDSFKTKREKKRMNYYINKLNEFERLLND